MTIQCGSLGWGIYMQRTGYLGKGQKSEHLVFVGLERGKKGSRGSTERVLEGEI